MQEGLDLTPSTAGMEQIARLSFVVAQEFAEQFGALVADYSPYLTGTNRGSIVIRPVDNDTAWIIATTSNYGAYLELGTTKMEAQPYFAPAFEQTRRDWLSRGRL